MSNKSLLGFRSLLDFLEWYKEVCNTRIFWAKPLNEVKVEKKDGYVVLRIIRMYKRRKTLAYLILTPNLEGVELPDGDPIYVLMLSEEMRCRRRSSVFLYSVDTETLEPNRDVSITVVRGREAHIEELRNIQKRSWGFFIPPFDYHFVLIASFNRIPIGSAYLNPKNGNLDFGIHVVRSHWRRRIGSRLLREALILAKKMKLDRVSVVRVLGRSKSADERALSFYRANNPSVGLTVCELSRNQGRFV